MANPVLLTGAAGFIGFHVARRLLASGERVVGVDNMTPFYDPVLKADRLRELERFEAFMPVQIDLADPDATRRLFEEQRPRRVLHLAAQAGVRPSLERPAEYVQANVVAFLHVLEGCRHTGVEHLVYASSSSVYGGNRKLPFAAADPVERPLNLYAATKRADELMAHAYGHAFGLPTTGLRYFTVYGPWGRPDMAVFTFTDRIARGEPIEIANGGEVWRDFTYIDDAVEATLRLFEPVPERRQPPELDSGARIYNVGNDRAERLDRLVELIERELGRTAVRIARPLPPGDMVETRADIAALRRDTGFAPTTTLEEGVKRFVAWYRGRYG